ncbi:hypothetical protein [uncultured Rhodoblastus sp.]|uniref:hypothetical protein n=1 Tax=uncultured Rhodoblastus sp. TaxID=543037 RepID=UPI0025FD9014|nr:hypothetical protein [uncultured Rhodoblastus sp.]
MNQKHLTLIWQWMSVACLLFLLTSIVSIQGGSDFVGKLLGDKGATLPDNRPAIGYFGAIVGSGLFLIASFTLFLHARRHGDRWHNRVPVLWLEGLDTFAWEAKFFQVVVIILFLALPAAAIVLCIAEAERGDICELDTNHFYNGSDKTLFWPPRSIEGHQMRLRREGSGNLPCTSGIEIFPSFLTPFLVYWLPALSGCMAFMAFAKILMGRPQKSVVDSKTFDDVSG